VLTGMYGTDPLLVFVRTHGNERVVVAHNLADTTSSNTFHLRARGLDPLFTDPGTAAILWSAPDLWSIQLPPHSTAIWREQ